MMNLTRRKLWFAIFVLVVLAIGFGAGVAADRYLSFPRRPFGRPPKPAEIADRMSRELGLSADQHARLEVVFQRNGDRLEQFRAQTRAQFDTLRKQLDAEIIEILTPEQRATFEEQRKRREHGPMRPGGGMRREGGRGLPPP